MYARFYIEQQWQHPVLSACNSPRGFFPLMSFTALPALSATLPPLLAALLTCRQTRYVVRSGHGDLLKHLHEPGNIAIMPDIMVSEH